MSNMLTRSDGATKKIEKSKCVGEVEIAAGEESGRMPMGCVCNKQKFDLERSEQLGSFINQIVSAHKRWQG